MRRYIKTFMCISAATLFLSGCGTKKTEVPTLIEPVNSAIESMPVVVTDVYEVSVYTAEVIPKFLELSAEDDGTVSEVMVRVGDKVSEGDTLIRLKSGTSEEYERLAEQLSDMRKQNDYANRISEINIRISQLYGQDTSYQELELKQQKERQALEEKRLQNRMDALFEQESQASVSAPCDGVVVSLGETADGYSFSQGAPLIVIADESSKYVCTEYINRRTIEESHECYALIGDERYGLSLSHYSDATGQKQTTMFSVDNEDGLSLGDYACVYVIGNYREQVVAAPVNAIYEEDGSKYVYIVMDNARVRTPITTGVEGAMYVEVLSGLQEGDRVYVPN